MRDIRSWPLGTEVHAQSADLSQVTYNTYELNVNRPSTPRPIRRIGLISPCSGNLGNAAIITAMIANVRERVPDVEFVGITLSPDDTRHRHGIQAFPIAALSRPNYTLFRSGSSENGGGPGVTQGKIKQWVKRVPLLRGFLRAIRTFGQELAHIAAAARLVRTLDRLVIPGGGALDEFWGGPWGHPWSLFKWSVLGRACGVPMLFVSIGKCSLERPLSRFFARRALSLAQFRSYRDQHSKAAVQSLIDARNDPVYPDLAFSYPSPIPPPAINCASARRRLVIGVSPIAYCDPRGWPIKDERRYAAYLKLLTEVVKWLLRERHEVILFSTDGLDVDTVNDLQAMVSDSSIDAGAIQILPGPPEQTTDGLLHGLCRADLIIATRLHGVILSHLSATPALALSTDPKVDSHMSEMGQKEYCLHVDRLQAPAVIERFGALELARYGEAARLRAAAQIFRQQLGAQYDELFGVKLSSPSLGGLQEQIAVPPPSFQMN